MKERLKKNATALLTERIGFLGREAYNQAVLALMLGDVFDHILHCG